jgi:uncharacterized protein (DUF2267 family)
VVHSTEAKHQVDNDRQQHRQHNAGRDRENHDQVIAPEDQITWQVQATQRHHHAADQQQRRAEQREEPAHLRYADDRGHGSTTVRGERQIMGTQRDQPDAIGATVQKTNRWIKELSEELGGVSRREAYRVLRGFLHALRDRLPVDEAAQLGAQLPMLVRGLYYEGWDPSRAPRKMRAEEFVEAFAGQAALRPSQEPGPALRAAACVWRRHISEGEVVDVLSTLPEDVRRLLE